MLHENTSYTKYPIIDSLVKPSNRQFYKKYHKGEIIFAQLKDGM